MKKRAKRHAVIRSIVRNNEIRTQRDLVLALQNEGYECTQATISRDINDMGLEKATGGIYMLGEDLRFKRLAVDLMLDIVAANNLIIVKTRKGMAQGVAAAIDDAQLENILGTIAGDDTIFMVTATPEMAEHVFKTLDALR